jgi:DNA repair ATPase RecN
MADPLSVAASVLSVLTAAVKSTKSLHGAVSRYKKRDRTLSHLQGQLEDLIQVLDSLHEAVQANVADLELLLGPIDRCAQICKEFEIAMANFDERPSAGLKDWARMEFKGGDIKDFMDNLTSYKATISMHLGTITM